MSSGASQYVGYIIIDKDGTLNVEFRVNPDGSRTRNFFQLQPNHVQYKWYLEQVDGEMVPGHRYGLTKHPDSN